MGNILQMPQRNKGRVRKTESWGAAGTLGMRFVGAAPGGKVVLLDDARPPAGREEQLDLLTVALFGSATDRQKKRIRGHIDWMTEERDLEKRLTARSLQRLLSHHHR